MSDEVTVQTAEAPQAAVVTPEPIQSVVESPPSKESEQERVELLGGAVAAVIAVREVEQAQLDELQRSIAEQEAAVKKKLAEVAKASEKKVRSSKVDELKRVLFDNMPHPHHGLKIKHMKDQYGSAYTDDEYEQALKELVETGGVILEQGFYYRKL